jgi:alkanesulfonate monooxygenase SsuD/methylene tetrahydromethanopterin reductase-like flavin-dependent oxidoreductase (luciferase family)
VPCAAFRCGRCAEATVFISYFTERPYQDPDSGFFGGIGIPLTDLELSNKQYNPQLASKLHERYFEEMQRVEEVGFDGIILNEHHSTPFCMGGVMDVEAAILAQITKKARIVLLGNILPIWDDPLRLAEELALIDVISKGRLVTGWVRGTGRESISHNAASPYNWERFQEAHDLIVKTWTTDGPFRWEGEHFNYRYVNPWARPYQQPRPPIWIPGVMSKNTVRWAAEHRYPFIMLATALEPTRQSFDYYYECAREFGYEAGTQNIGYNFKVHVDETEELAEATARKYIEGPSNPFLEGNQGVVKPYLQNLPGMTSRTQILPTGMDPAALAARGRGGSSPSATPPPPRGSYEDLTEKWSIVTGTPTTVIPKIRHVLEYLRPGNVIFWDGDGAMNHDDTMRSLKLFGEEVLPAVREIGKELDLKSAFEVDPATGKELAPAGA